MKLFFGIFKKVKKVADLSPLASDASGELDVLGHDGDTLGVDGAQVGVLEETDQVSLGGFLKNKEKVKDKVKPINKLGQFF